MACYIDLRHDVSACYASFQLPSSYLCCVFVFSQSNDEKDISDENGEEAEDQINCENKGQFVHARNGRILLCSQQQ